MKNTNFLKTKLIANRGIYNNKTIFENTLEAFNLAIEKELMIHLSVNITKDNILVVYHDHDLTRLTNLKDRVETLTYEELNYLSSFKIPTLEESLKLINGRVPIIINPRNYSNKYYLEKELVKYLDDYQGLFAIVNKRATIIKWFNRHRPDYIIGEVLAKKAFNKRSIRDFMAHYAIITDFKSVNIRHYTPRKIKALKMNNMVLGYVADTQEKYLQFKDVCDNLFIDNVEDLEF